MHTLHFSMTASARGNLWSIILESVISSCDTASQETVSDEVFLKKTSTLENLPKFSSKFVSKIKIKSSHLNFSQ